MSAPTSKSTPTTPSKTRTSNLVFSHLSSPSKENEGPESPSFRPDSRRDDHPSFQAPAKSGEEKASMPILNNDQPSTFALELRSQGAPLSAAESYALIRSKSLEVLREKGQGQFVIKYLNNPKNDKACWIAFEKLVEMFFPNQRIQIEANDLGSHHVFKSLMDSVLPAIIITAAGDVSQRGLGSVISLELDHRHWKSVFPLVELTKNSGSDYVLKSILKNFSKVQAAITSIFAASQLEEVDRTQIMNATLLISLLTDDQTWITGSPHLVIGLKTASLRKLLFKLLDLSKRAGALSVCEILNSFKGRSPGLSDEAPSHEDIENVLLFGIDQQKERIKNSNSKQDSSESPASQEALHMGAGLPEIDSSSSLSTSTAAVTGPTGISEPQDTPVIKKSHPRPDSSPLEADSVTGRQPPKPDGHVDQKTRLESSNLSSTPSKLTSTNPTSSIPRPNELFKSQGGPYDASFEHDPLQSSSPSVRNEKRLEGVKMIQTLRARTFDHGSAGGSSGRFDLKSKSGNLQSSSSSGPSSSSSLLNPSRSQHPIVSAHEYFKSESFLRQQREYILGENQASNNEIAQFESSSESEADTEYETQSDSSKTQTEEHEESQTGDENEVGDEDSEGRNGEEVESENEEETGFINTEELEIAFDEEIQTPIVSPQQAPTRNASSGGFRFFGSGQSRGRDKTQESNDSQDSLGSLSNNRAYTTSRQTWGPMDEEVRRWVSDLSEDETGSQRSEETVGEDQKEGVQDQLEDEGGVGGGIEIERLEDNVGAPAGNDDLQDEA